LLTGKGATPFAAFHGEAILAFSPAYSTTSASLPPCGLPTWRPPDGCRCGKAPERVNDPVLNWTEQVLHKVLHIYPPERSKTPF